MRVLMIHERHRYSGGEDPAIPVKAALRPGAGLAVPTLYEDGRRIDGCGSVAPAPRSSSGYRRRLSWRSIGCSG